MYLNNQFVKKGLNNLVNRQTRAVHMNLDLDLWVADAGDCLELMEQNDEIVVLLLTGDLKIAANNQVYHVQRQSLFDQTTSCFNFAQQTKIILTANQKTEVLIIKTANSKMKKDWMITGDQIKEQMFGKGQFDNTTLRLVRTYSYHQNNPDSNLVVGEVVNYPGRWSSYLPHYHDQPEIYFFKFDKPQGFGISVAGETASLVYENDVQAIEANVTHPVVAAPGYPLYFCWIIRHLDNNPWTLTRKTIAQHQWLEAPDATYWSHKKKLD